MQVLQMMSLASQSNDSTKREFTGPFEASVVNDNSVTPVAVATGMKTNASGVDINIEPVNGLEPKQIEETLPVGTIMNGISINGISPQPLLETQQVEAQQVEKQLVGTQQVGTNMNTTLINPTKSDPETQQLGTNINQSAMNVKIEPSNNPPLQQSPVAQQVGLNMQNNFAATSLVPGGVQNGQANQSMNPLLKAPVTMTAPIVPTMPTASQTAVPLSQATPQNLPKLLGTTMNKNIQNLSSLAGATGTVRNSNGGGGQLLQFPWKLHEMLHLAEKNGKTAIISWLPGGNGFKVHNKEKFCAEIMPGYFASQKYKTFQRSLNLWGFESVAKGPDRGACYHQYFVKGHPELCHNMTRVKIKGQSNPRTPAAAAAAAAAAKRAAMTAAITAGQQQPQQVQGITPQQQAQQQQQQPLNMFTMNHFLQGMPMGMPQLGMQVAATNPAIANANLMAAAASNPYAFAMNNFVAMNALQQMNPALAAASLQNPAMNAVIAAQVMAAAAANNQQAQAQMTAVAQQQQPVQAAQRQGAVAPVPGSVLAAPTMAPCPTASGIAAPIGLWSNHQQQQQQQQQIQQQAQQQAGNQQRTQLEPGVAPVAQTPFIPGIFKAEAVAPGQAPVPANNVSATNASSAANADANFAEFLSRKAALERQQQPQTMPFATDPKIAAPGNNTAIGSPAPIAATNLAAQSAPAPAPVNVSAPEVNTEGAVAV